MGAGRLHRTKTREVNAEPLRHFDFFPVVRRGANEFKPGAVCQFTKRARGKVDAVCAKGGGKSNVVVDQHPCFKVAAARQDFTGDMAQHFGWQRFLAQLYQAQAVAQRFFEQQVKRFEPGGGGVGDAVNRWLFRKI